MENRFASRGIGGPPESYTPPTKVRDIHESLREEIALQSLQKEQIRYIPSEEDMMDISKHMLEVAFSPSVAAEIHQILVKKYPQFSDYFDKKLLHIAEAMAVTKKGKEAQKIAEQKQKNVDLRHDIRLTCNIEDISLLPRDEDIQFFRECILHIWTHPEDAPTLEKHLRNKFPHLQPWFQKRFSSMAHISQTLDDE